MKLSITYITEYCAKTTCKIFGHNEKETLSIHATVDMKTKEESNRYGMLKKRCQRCGKQLSKKKLKGDDLEKEIERRWVAPMVANYLSGGT